jgi:hypothetical protein
MGDAAGAVRWQKKAVAAAPEEIRDHSEAKLREYEGKRK